MQVIGEAVDGLEVVQKARTQQPDLILLDIGLPKLNGIEAAKRILEFGPSIRIIFLSQNNDKEVVNAALSTGAQGYVLKMDAGTELLPAIKTTILPGERFVSSGIKGRL